MFMNFEFLNALLVLFSGVLLESWNIFVETAPYLIFGLGIAGLLNVLVPDQKIVDYLGASAGKIRSVINAALAGLPLPLCSCGVVPAAMSIRKRGANRGATLSFLISTPETGVDSIAVTYALLDPLMAVFRPLAALVTAVLTGLADNFLIGECPEKKNITKQESPGKKTGVLTVSTLIGAPLQEKTWLNRAIGTAMILLSVLMLAFVVVKKWPHFGLCKLSKKYVNYPAFFGFLTGINVCPPFLLAMSAALSYASIAGSILLFGGFFVGTSFYLILLVPLGLAAKAESIRQIGLITAVMSGVMFFALGLGYLLL